MTTTTTTKTTITEYDLNMVDRDDPSAWMNAHGVINYAPHSPGLGCCRFRVWTTDQSALESALDADDDVLEYETIVEVDMAKVTAHAETEGRNDYTERARAVAIEGERPSWAWPMVDADAAYISAVTMEAICHEFGFSVDGWIAIRDTWLAGFVRGYEAAHAERAA